MNNTNELNRALKEAYPEQPEVSPLDSALATAGVTQPPIAKNTFGQVDSVTYDKPTVLAHIRKLVDNFSRMRMRGEGVGVAATVVQGTTLTAAGIVAGVTAGGTVVAGAAMAFPLTAAIAAIAVITGVILRQKAINDELRVNLIMIKGEVERLYNIYKVIEEIAKEKKLPINTDMVRKFTIILSNNILLVAGPDTFEMIKTMSLGNGEAFFQEEKMGTLSTFTTQNIKNQRKAESSSWFKFSFLKRTIIPGEVLRTIVRDITILTVFFTILQSEFDLLSREKEEKDRVQLFSAIATDSGIKFQPNTVKAFEQYFKSNKWINSDVFKRFKSQLPANNLNIAINDASEGAASSGSNASNPFKPVTSANIHNNSSNPSTPSPQNGSSRTMRRRKLGKKRQSRRYN
jgi:hypothetical protein